jgi:hypothetical protein
VSDSAPDALHLLAQDVAVLKRDYSGLHQDVSGLGNKIDALTAQVSAQQRTNWPLILSIGTVLLAVIGGGWKVVDLQNQLTVAMEVGPLQSDLRASNAEQDSLSESVERIRNGQAEIRGSISTVTQKISEMEVQDCAISDNARLAFGSLRQLLAVLWAEVRKDALPQIEMMPRVGRCN